MSTSALPRPVRLRLPCFATFAPAAAAIMAAAVETLNSFVVPPVPAVSKSVSAATPVSTGSTWARMTVAAPASSSAVGTRVANSASNAPISAGWHSPDIRHSNAACDSPRRSVRPPTSAAMNGVKSPLVGARANSGNPLAFVGVGTARWYAP